MPQANPNIKAVYASNVMMAAGARVAVKGAEQEGRLHQNHWDGRPARPSWWHPAVAECEWGATLTYPTGGHEADEMAKAILLDSGGALRAAPLLG